MLPKRKRCKHRICIPPGYNWCGPGCSGPGAPINAVDAACRAHDLCYARDENHCICDKEFLWRLRPYINDYTKMGKDARLMHRYMRLQILFNCSFYEDE